MQKKLKLSALTVALLLMLSVTASALSIQPRWSVTATCDPILTFSGTVATCRADIWADTGAKISGTMTLYRVSGGNEYKVDSWSFSGTTSAYPKETCSVTKGNTYKLVVDVTVSGSGGSDTITVNTTKKCS